MALLVAFALVIGLSHHSLHAEEADVPGGYATKELTQDQADRFVQQSKNRLEAAKEELHRVLANDRSNDPKIVRLQQEFERRLKMDAIMLRLAPMMVGPRNVEKQQEITRLYQKYRDLVAVAEEQEALADDKNHSKAAAFADAIQLELEKVKQELSQSQLQMMETAKQLAKQERDRALPSLENAELKIFALKSLPAPSAASAIENLFGEGTMRVAVDERTNSLIVLGKPESIQLVEALLTNLDQKVAQDRDAKKPQQQKAATQSLLLRLFWLADGLPDGEGIDPATVLPASVLKATKKLGLAKPQLVAQTMSALAVGGDEAAEFSANVPALLIDHSVDLNCQGKVTLTEAGQATVAMYVNVHGKGISCELQGSLAMPLSHYMVLGTANSVIPKSTVGPPLGAAGGVPGGEFGPDGGLVAPETVPGEVAMRGQPQPEAKFSTFRFAFVVQVIEAESFAPEE